MSLYMQTDKPAPASRVRGATSRDVFSSPDSVHSNVRVPSNPKFAAVRATIDTGANVGNVKKKVDRSGESFRRINRRQLHQLLLACEQGDESIYALQERWDDVDDASDTSSVQSGRTTRSSSSSNASGAGAHAPLVATHASMPPSPYAASAASSSSSAGGAAAAGANGRSAAGELYILLDVRDDDVAFSRFHISGALHYPPALLRRDHFPPTLYALKNAPGKLVIVYDSDDTTRAGLEAATLFVQKGWQNVFLLTGGVRHFCDKYTSRVEGTHVPQPKPLAAAAGGASVSARSQSMAGTPASSHRLGTGQSGVGGASSRLGSAGPPQSAAASGRASARSSSGGLGSSGGFGAPAAASARSGAPATPAAQNYSATALGFRGLPTQELESPRDALGRQQQQHASSAHHSQQQQQPPPSSSRSSASSASSSGAMHAPSAGRSQISSRAFR